MHLSSASSSFTTIAIFDCCGRKFENIVLFIDDLVPSRRLYNLVFTSETFLFSVIPPVPYNLTATVVGRNESIVSTGTGTMNRYEDLCCMYDSPAGGGLDCRIVLALCRLS